jgi:NAD(P)-dependent dehydrogenase (short-subunit alcohol dehydrogenase family)
VTDAGHPTRPTHPIAIVTGATGAIDSATARRLAAALLDHEAIAAAKARSAGWSSRPRRHARPAGSASTSRHEGELVPTLGEQRQPQVSRPRPRP